MRDTVLIFAACWGLIAAIVILFCRWAARADAAAARDREPVRSRREGGRPR